MSLKGKKIGILIEGDYYEPEIWYYKHRFAEEEVDLHFLTRMWGQTSAVMTAGFKGHEYKIPFDGYVESFEDMDDETLRSYSAIIVPAGMVSDRLRFTEDIHKLPPATVFLKRAFAEKSILKGIICHGMWLVAPAPEMVLGRRGVVHNNLLGDARNMGLVYVDQDVVVDGDFVTGRTGGHCHQFARMIIDILSGVVKPSPASKPIEINKPLS